MKKKKPKNHDLWPVVRFAKSKQRWLVDTRTGTDGKTGCRRFFETMEEAETFATRERGQRADEGRAAYDNSELKVYGWSVADAIKFALEHLRQQEQSLPLPEAVTQFLAFKKPRVGDRRHLDMKQRLDKIAGALGEEPICHFTEDDLNDYLDTIPHGATRNDYRKEIVTLWRYARRKKWTTLTLDKDNVPRAKEPDKARVILNLEQAVELMKASADPEMRALNAMVLFGGVRVEEVEKLDWSDVDFKTGHINITAEVSKVNSERFAPMSDNLKAWLAGMAEAAAARRDEKARIAREKGKIVDAAELKKNPIITRTLMHVQRATWKAASIYPWPQDAHRHSFISYRRQIVGDSKTALEAGTSERIIKRHYKRPVTDADAKAFFEITPQGLGLA
jgi:integrase